MLYHGVARDWDREGERGYVEPVGGTMGLADSGAILVLYTGNVLHCV